MYENGQMFVLFNPIEWDTTVYPALNDWNGTTYGIYKYRHYLNWNMTYSMAYNANGSAPNPPPATKYNVNDTSYNYEKKMIDIQVKIGWSYVVWNFYNNATINDFKVQMYYINAD